MIPREMASEVREHTSLMVVWARREGAERPDSASWLSTGLPVNSETVAFVATGDEVCSHVRAWLEALAMMDADVADGYSALDSNTRTTFCSLLRNKRRSTSGLHAPAPLVVPRGEDL